MMKLWVDNGWASWIAGEFPAILISSAESPIIVRMRPDLPRLPIGITKTIDSHDGLEV